MPSKPGFGKIVAAAFLAGATAVPSLAEAPKATPRVETEHGIVQGLKDDGIDAYLGLRYAAPPVGDLRFMPPQPLEDWAGIYDAANLGAPCMQMYSPSGPNATDTTVEMQSIFPTAGESKIDNEDCLFLNVWTPAPDMKKRPVLVWFHGGGYAYGSGGWPVYDGRNLAAKGDMVVVTVNHRLNAFGYTYLGDKFGESAAMSGNVGNLDLVASLEWVRDNIARFGGDPDNVTIAGESGGGSKVSHLLATPAAAGLFDKAVIQSGPGVTSGKKDEAARLASDLMENLGVTTLAELQSVPAESLLSAAREVLPERGMTGGGPNFGPIVDGVVLPRDPFIAGAPGQSKDVPVMIGYNDTEMTLFTASQPWFGTLTAQQLDAMAKMMGPEAVASVDYYRKRNPGDAPTYIANKALSGRFSVYSYVLADMKARQGGAPVYFYNLNWRTPAAGGALRSPHTLDLPLMFDNVDISGALVGTGKDAQTMAEMMSDAWISFARNGTPSSDLLPTWTPYDTATRSIMVLDLEPEIVSDPEAGLRAIYASK